MKEICGTLYEYGGSWIITLTLIIALNYRLSYTQLHFVEKLNLIFISVHYMSSI